jgi:hypothetical protein
VKLVFAILGISFLITDISGQIDTIKNQNDSLPKKSYVLRKVERDGVTMPEVEIKEVTVIGRPGPAARREFQRNERLIYNIKKVYPYSIMVRMRLNQVNEDLKSITDEKERKNYLKNVEKNVFAEYEEDMRQMTITQGRILIKLIDRETQNTSFNLIRDFRGKFTAAFWQGVARIFGSNLKEEYDRNGDDAMIELIINEIEAGRL